MRNVHRSLAVYAGISYVIFIAFIVSTAPEEFPVNDKGTLSINRDISAVKNTLRNTEIYETL